MSTPFMSFEEFTRKAEIDFDSATKEGFHIRKLTAEELMHDYRLASINHYTSQEEDELIDHVYGEDYIPPPEREYLRGTIEDY